MHAPLFLRAVFAFCLFTTAFTSSSLVAQVEFHEAHSTAVDHSGHNHEIDDASVALDVHEQLTFVKTPVGQGVLVDIQEQALFSQLVSSKVSVASRSAAQIASFPLANTEEANFSIVRTSAMHPELQARYPEIVAFSGHQIDRPEVKIRAEYSPSNGWTYSINDPNSGQTLLRSDEVNGSRQYTLHQKAKIEHSNFVCHVEDDGSAFAKTNDSAPTRRAGDCKLRKYRMAITCTGEYAQAVDGSNPDAAGVLAAMNVAINRVNEVYERDLAITLEIIPENDQLLFFNGATDPYTEGSPGAMINEVQTQIDAIIGTAAYDIGHIFSTRGGGLAQLFSPCSGNKARGVTGITNPTGDGFYIDYVAHEVGHQFSATHTFYNSCSGNRTTSTAFEPGSGSTIMAYAGICAPNVQNRSDDYFHVASIEQIGAFVTSANGSCGAVQTATNTPPNVTGLDNLSIPIGTAFELTAIATDAENDPLTYCWEQYDNVLGGTMPPVSTNTQGPLFRSLDPSSSPTRRFPSGNFTTYEVLPTVERDLNFKVTVRDNGSSFGCTTEETITLSSVGSTPFAITNFNTATTVDGLSSQTITWNVAGTASAPVNAPTVDVFLSLDGGLTYSTTLLEDVPNNGSATVTIPNINASNARFVVKGHDHVFLDVNDAVITIEEASVPTFTISVDAAAASSCAGADATYFFEIESLLGFSESITLSLSGLPSGAATSFNNNDQSGNFVSLLSVTGLSTVATGTYPLVLTAQSSSVQRVLNLELVVGDLPTATPTTVTPADAASVGRIFTLFEWTFDATQGNVRLQLSQDPTFVSGGFVQDFDRGEVTATGLSEGVWYYRIAYVNECGPGPFSDLQSFLVIPLVEDQFTSTGAVTIGGGNPGSYSSTINVPRAGQVYRIETGTQISHTYVGDLDATLALSSGPTLDLFGRSGGGQCASNNIETVFADNAQQTAADFVGTCNAAAPAISGVYQPAELFFGELPREGAGDYVLTVRDNEAQDGGAINNWDITLWYANLPNYSPTLGTAILSVPQGGSATATTSNLTALEPTVQSTDVRWVVKALPQHGTLLIDGAAAILGSTFTASAVGAGLVRYMHNAGSSSATDEITFDVIFATAGYYPNQVLPIGITNNPPLTATAAITQDVSCFNGSDGEIVVTANGGDGTYTYSLNGGTPTASNTFAGLSPGSYTFTVSDGAGEEVTTQALTLNNPPELTLVVSVSGSTITAVGAGGTGTLTYQLDNQGFGSNNVFTNVTDGAHVVVVRDANGCEIGDQVVVAVDNLIVELEAQGDILCFGDLITLSADAQGGAQPYSYSLNGGPAQSSPDFPNQGAGQYTVTVTDDNGLTASSSMITLIEPTPLMASADVTGNDVDVDASGGTTPYTYSIDGQNFQNGDDFENLANGTYTITVVDANGCQTTTTATVQVDDLQLDVAITGLNLCFGDNDGVLVAMGSGGIPPYAYRLDNGSFQSSGVFSDLPSGSYTITVQDDEGNQVTETGIVITQPDELILSASVNGSDVTLSAVGGTTPYQYNIVGATPQTDPEFPNLNDGSYTFEVTDANGCKATLPVIVNGSSNLTLSITFNLGQESCPGADDGAVTLMGVDGVAPYEYSLDGTNYQAGSFFNNLAPNSYTGYVRDATNAVATSVFEILERQVPTVDVTVSGSFVELSNFTPASTNLSYSFDGGTTFSSDPFGYIYEAGAFEVIVRYGSCEFIAGGTIVDPLIVEGEDIVVCSDAQGAEPPICVNGGVAPYTWTSTAGTLSLVNLNGCDLSFFFAFDPLNGPQSVTITDATGATQSYTVNVTVFPELTVTGTVSGDSLTIQATGGTAPYLYSIENGANPQSSPVFVNLPDGPVTALVTDANGCSTSVTVTVSSIVDAAAIGLSVFPNPTSSNLNVTFSSANRILEVQLIDVAGRIVYVQRDVESSTTQIAAEELPEGFYTLMVKHETGLSTIPVIVK